MAGNGLFRSSFRGFNRQDVLNYIDTLQRENEQQLQELQKQLDAVKAQEAEARQALNEKQGELETAMATAASLQTENDQLQELIDEHNRVNRELRAKLEEQSLQQQGQSKLELDNARLQAVNATLREQQAQYQAVTGRLEDITAQMRKYSLSFLGTSCKRSEECLDTMEKMVAAYESELAETRRRIGEARQTLEEQKNAAGVHLDELLNEILEGKPYAKPVSPVQSPATPKAEAVNTAPVSKPRLVQQQRPAHRRPGGWLANLLK